MNRSEWLEERRKSLGGSDAAAILGLNEWVTPYSVWAEKTGRLQEKEDSEAMRQGRDLEQYVAERFMEASGKKCRRRRQIIRNEAYPFAHANIDRWIIGENAGLECKTTNLLNLKQFRNGKYPDTYYCQCVHYMAVTGAEKWYLAVLVFGKGFFVFEMERDEKEISALMKAEEAFWRHVEEGTPPPLDGMEATSAALENIYAESKRGETWKELFGQEKNIRRYLELAEHIRELEREKRFYEQQLKEDLGEWEKGECGIFQVIWKQQKRECLDKEAFSKAYPEIDLNQYCKTTSYRRFSVIERSSQI